MRNLYKIEDELYIISDKEKSSYCIKECTMAGLNIDRCDCPIQGGCSNKVGTVILTTNNLLIKDGVQAIDDTFLEWFVKNPSCEEVEVKKECCGQCDERLCEVYDLGIKELDYKIVLPKEDQVVVNKMEEFTTPTNRIDYKHFIIHNDTKYIRSETMWVSKPLQSKNKLDFHTIKWELSDGEGNPEEYYSEDMGWSSDGHLKKSNPIPEIEKVFKDTIGKDLIYF
jgi:hypothetical protein